MFKRLSEASGRVLSFTFDGQPLEGREGDSLAAALLAGGVGVFRTTVPSDASRGPYCLMGVCFDCLVEVDGVANRQACMIPLREGMCVTPQRRARQLGE